MKPGKLWKDKQGWLRYHLLAQVSQVWYMSIKLPTFILHFWFLYAEIYI